MTVNGIYVLTTLALCGLAHSASVGVSSLSEPLQWAYIARDIIRSSDWASVASISTQKNITGYPYVSLKSVSDGKTKKDSTGVPYVYTTDLTATAKDFLADNRVTLMVSRAQSDYCKINNFDPQGHQCPRIFFTGRFVKVDKNSKEYELGKDALFAKHPEMKEYPENHGFYVAKVVPEHIAIMAGFGGLKEVSVKDYFSDEITNLINSSDAK